MIIYYLLVGVFALAFSLAIGLFITSILLVKSNDLGNSKGDFSTFTKHPLVLLKKKDRIPQDWY